MKVFTEKDFNKFDRDEIGRIICPSGDYRQIRQFPAYCLFGERCLFGAESTFGMMCSFGKNCSFGDGCSFGKWSYFDDACSFGKKCSFGARCSSGKACSFGAGCCFGERCSFDEECFFDSSCSFGGWSLFKKSCKALNLFWEFIYEPPFKTEGKIYPTPACREYWEERLGMELEGCYKEIEKKIAPKLPKILKRKDLTRCERRILESWLPKKIRR